MAEINIIKFDKHKNILMTKARFVVHPGNSKKVMNVPPSLKIVIIQSHLVL